MSRCTKNTAPCTSCRKPTNDAKLGLCSGCYQRRRRGHLTDGRCAVCGVQDLRVLCRRRLTDGLTTLCANDAAIAGRRPLSVAELTAERFPPGDRRDRERRASERRAPRERRTRVDLDRVLEDDKRRGRRR